MCPRTQILFSLLFLLLPAAPGSAEVSTPSVIIARPEGDPTNAWLGASVEAYLRFRLGGLKGVVAVSPDTLRKRIPDFPDFTRPIPTSRYRKVAEALKADYVVSQNVDATDPENIQYFLEIIHAADNTILADREASFPVSDLEKELDESVALMLEKLKISATEEEQRFLRVSVLGRAPEHIHQLGEAAIPLLTAPGKNALQAAQALQTLLDAAPRMLLATYLAQDAYERAQAWDKAARFQRDIISVLPSYASLYPRLCRSNLQTEDYKQAIEFFQEGQKRAVTSQQFLIDGARAHAAGGEFETAKRLYGQVLESDPKNLRALLFFATSANRENDPKQALSYSSQALGVEPEDGTALLEKGKALMALNRLTEALTVLDKAAGVLQADPQPLMLSGDILVKKKQWAKAAATFEQAFALSPRLTAAGHKAAEAYEAAGNLDGAVKALSSLPADERQAAPVQQKMGLLLYRLNRKDEAFPHLARAKEGGQSDAELLMALASIYLERRQYREAETILKTATKIASVRKAATAMKGELHLSKGEYADALRHLSEVAAKDPSYPGILKNTAEACLHSGDSSQALVFLQRHAKQAGDSLDNDSRRKIAHLTYTLEGAAAAREELQALTNAMPADSEALYLLALSYLSHKQPEKAKQTFEKAQTQGTTTAARYAELADGFARAGDEKLAMQLYEKAVRLDSSEPVFLDSLASLQQQTGELRKAATTYERLFALDKKRYISRIAEAGHLCHQAGDAENAKRLYQAYLDYGQSDTEVNVAFATLLFAEKRFGEVASLLQKSDKPISNTDTVTSMLAYSLFHTAKYARALPYVRKLLSASPSNPQLLAVAGAAADSAGETAVALSCYERLLTRQGKEPDADLAYRIGELREKQGGIEKAADRYARNTKLFPEDMRSYVKLFEFYESKDNVNALQALLTKAVSKATAPASFHKRLAKLLEGKKDTDAIEQYEKYLATEKRDSTAWLSLGRLYFKQKKFDDAARALSEANRMMPTDAECLVMLARSQKELGNCREAVHQYEKLRKAGQAAEEHLSEQADCYRVLKDSQGLIAVLDQLHSMKGDDRAIASELGHLLLSAGTLKRGVSVLEKALDPDGSNLKLHQTLAGAYGKLGDTRRQTRHLERVLTHKAKDPRIHFELAQLYERSGNAKRTAELYQAATALKKDYHEAHYAYALFLAQGGKMKRAKEHLESAVNIKPDAAEYQAALAKVSLSLDDLATAQKAIEKAVRLDRTNATYLRGAGEIAERLDDLTAAAAYYNQAVTSEPGCLSCRARQAVLHTRSGQYEKALAIFEEVFGQGKQNDTLAIFQARAYAHVGQWRKAERILRDILERNPRNAEALYRLGHIYLENNRMKDAQRLQGLRASTGRSAWAILLSAELREKGELQQEALKAFLEAIRLAPRQSPSYAGAARVYISLNQTDKAMLMAGKAMAFEPQNPEYLILMGTVYEATRQLDAALGMYEEALRLTPRNPAAYFYVGRALSRQNQLEKAEQILLKGLALDPKNPQLHMGLGHVLRAIGRNDEAMEAYEKAAREGDDEFVDAFRHIAMIHYKRLDHGKCKRYLKKYKRKGGTSPEADRMLQQLDK